MADKVVIPADEFAVKLTQDINGGLGKHAKGTVLRGLSASAFNTLVCGGFAKRVVSTTSGDIVDADELTSSADSDAAAAAAAGGAPKGAAAKT